MLQPTIQRVSQGICIDGEQFGLQLLPYHNDGRVNVTVYANPSLTGYDRAARVTSDEIPNCFTSDEISVSDTELTCLAADMQVPFYRQGFTIILEPGMTQLLRDWLPRLFKVATLASEIAGHAHQQLVTQDPPAYLQHLYDIFSRVSAGVVLDGLPPNEASKREIKRDCRQTDDFRATLCAAFEMDKVLVPLTRAHVEYDEAAKRNKTGSRP